MLGNRQDDFESLARRYWAAWGDALRNAVPGAGAIPGMGGPQHASPLGAEAWQESIDWWTRLAHGGRSEANDALAHFNRQARQWYARMQEVAARFAGQEATAVDVARAWKEALGASGENPFPEMLRSLRGHHLQGLEQWVEDASPWLDSIRDEGLSWLRMPAFGAGREHQERLQRLAAHVAEYHQASSAYGALMAKAQQEAFAIFENRLIDHEEPGRQLQSGRALFDLWIDAAEEAYAEVALSPEFREVYGNLVNAQMRVRAGVQRMVEDACAQFGMPTRTELDGAHRKLAQLEREVRRLRDAAGRMHGQGVPQRVAAPARRPVRAAAATVDVVEPAVDEAVAARRVARPAKKAAKKPAKRTAKATPKKAVKKAAKKAAKKLAKRPAARTAKKPSTKAAAKTVKAAAKSPAKTAAKKAAKRAAPAGTMAGRGARRPSARAGFGGAIAGSIPRAPEPMASKSAKKAVKKGKR
ncbi:class III poly(R)-hydroxyalkanoic acid synthase subunit PhaE [Luteimonas arsenica]|uniref:class III poly(R)-hydroxyalkanoic acid synthase subunit PhaE n=1 Tax=Luteimonas arsenica TaxID=1586242 RepID=UPI00105580B4|nr:class III poly(R)-hydroxyalkanoic acid synthase subunit PhaE [Luteimonas arsenica]